MAGLGGTINKAKESGMLSQDEGGFILALIERYRQEIGRKSNQMLALQGELAQLRANENIIKDLLNNMVNAAERDKARVETAAAIRGHREEAVAKKVGATIEDAVPEDTEEKSEVTPA